MTDVHADALRAIGIEVARSSLRRVIAVVLAEVDGKECTKVRCRAHGIQDGYYLRSISVPLFASLADIVRSAVRYAMGPGGPYPMHSGPWRENVQRGILLWVVGWIVIHSLTWTYLARRVSAYGSLIALGVR